MVVYRRLPTCARRGLELLYAERSRPSLTPSLCRPEHHNTSGVCSGVFHTDYTLQTCSNAELSGPIAAFLPSKPILFGSLFSFGRLPDQEQMSTSLHAEASSVVPNGNYALTIFPGSTARTFHKMPSHCNASDDNQDTTTKESPPSAGGLGQYMKELPKKTFLNSLLLETKKDHRLLGRESFLKEQIEQKYDDLMKRHEHLLVDGRAKTHLQLAAVVLASYRVLLPWMANDSLEVINVIKQPAGAAASATINVIQKVALFLSWNKFRYASNLLQNMEEDYGKAFEFEHFITDENHEARISKCLYQTVFEAEGTPELTSIFCALDRMWFTALDPSRHGVEFERPSTLAEGGPACRFIVRKTKT